MEVSGVRPIGRNGFERMWIAGRVRGVPVTTRSLRGSCARNTLEGTNRLIAEIGAVPDKMPRDEGIKGELPDEKIR